MGNSTQRNSRKGLTARIQELEFCSAEMRERIEKLEHKTGPSYESEEDELADPDLLFERSALSSKPQKSVMGRRPKLSNHDLARLRDALALLVHTMRVQFSEAIRKARSAPELGKLLVTLFPGRQGDLGLQHLQRNVHHLWDFLQSSRFANHIDRIPNAMAGVPNLSYRTSLDRCARLPLGKDVLLLIRPSD